MEGDAGQQEAEYGGGSASGWLPVSSAMQATRNRGTATTNTAARAPLFRSDRAAGRRAKDRFTVPGLDAAGLRAAGQPVAHDQRPGPVTLTPQQREIATLAAAGLTNKQIGERLYLSHRTVATRLYQIFPKLGVTSRAALRDALSGNEDREEADR